MAEGWGHHLKGNKFRVVSSGLESSSVNPTAIEVMGEAGVDITGQTSDPLSAFEPKDFDVVISLCGCNASLPEEWKKLEFVDDWQLDDPAGLPKEKFVEVRDMIKVRVEKLFNRLSTGGGALPTEPKELVEELVANNKVMVFSKSFCPYCKKTKAALDGIVGSDGYKVLEMDGRDDMDALQDVLKEITGGRSVPRVFLGGKFVGGCDDTMAKVADGSLNTMLVEAGVLAA